MNPRNKSGIAKPKGTIFSRHDDEKIETYAASGWSDGDIGASFFPPRSSNSIRNRRGVIGVSKGDAGAAYQSFWSDDEELRLEDGINTGLSWAEIGKLLPRRRLPAIKTRAILNGYARKMQGAYPQIPPDGDEDDALLASDPLLEKLREIHGEARA